MGSGRSPVRAGVDVVVGSRALQTLDPGLLRLHGIDPAACTIVGLKSEACVPTHPCRRELQRAFYANVLHPKRERR